jgi:predicted SAM-dependent methyltransferase
MPAGHEVVDKEELERGTFPQEVLADDGLVKLNIGSNTQMFHHNWNNCDILDLKGFAEQNAYKFHRFDLKAGIPYETESVDLVNMSHVLEHFSFKDVLSILRDLRRVIKPTGTVRITVPNLDLFKLQSLDEIVPVLDALNMDSEEYPTPVMKLYHALTANHLSGFDSDTLKEFAEKAGFKYNRMNFDQFTSSLMQKQCFDMFPDISLYADLTPVISQ